MFMREFCPSMSPLDATKGSIDHLQEQPLLLDSECVGEALGELERLLPSTTNVRHMLLRDPAYLLRVQRGQRRIGVHPDSFPDSSYLDVQTPRQKQFPRW